jgi:hypothetical protein
MAGLTLDVTSVNFGLHEYQADPPHVTEVFQGARIVKDGHAWVSEKPGWGIEVDEKLALRPVPRDRWSSGGPAEEGLDVATAAHGSKSRQVTMRAKMGHGT